ncbi:hypothetical protein PGT21_008181 [Puccinia graminis f. sp. tritici]|uniref:Secreted protein n=1 Tax=Puccinia graminis f. sp. tritici TaxID=56615 RepID=A0A5B0LS92_PUCGR|nr:hypothetical protein PGTUg99_032669 [Puccinia graminis f. sp. tritici]KAA1071461.1 hypothetical protein PGT21_008181 [Puccinia graminis f. sp. tritici]
MTKLCYHKLARLALLWALLFLSSSLGMPKGNAGKRCLVCATLDGQSSGRGIYRTQQPRERHDTLACSTLQTEPCDRQIPVQLHHCRICGQYAWVPTGDCLTHSRPQPIFSDSDDIELIRQRAAASVDTTLRL